VSRSKKADDRTTPIPYRGGDGRYHLLYVTHHIDTGEWYGGRHSTNDLNDGYAGSGDWPQVWKLLAPGMLVTEAIEFFTDVESLKRAEAKWITLATIAADPLCRNVQEGGHGLTSASAKALHAQPGVRAKRRASLLQSWVDAPDRRSAASARSTAIWADPAKAAAIGAAISAAIDPAVKAAAMIEIWARDGEKQKRSSSIRKAKAQAKADGKVRRISDAALTNQRATLLASWQDPAQNARMMAARAAAEPRRLASLSKGQAKRFARPDEREKSRQRRLDYLASNPDANTLNSQQKKALWNDPVWREKTLAAVAAGKAKMVAGPRAKRVETPDGAFPSAKAAAQHFGISRAIARRLIKIGQWRQVPEAESSS
jgi:hypothetical protein